MREELNEAKKKLSRAYGALGLAGEWLDRALEEIDFCYVIFKPTHGRVVLQYVQESQNMTEAVIHEARLIAEDSRLLVHVQFMSGVELVVRPGMTNEQIADLYTQKHTELEAARDKERSALTKPDRAPGWDVP